MRMIWKKALQLQVQAAALASESVLEVLGSQQIVERVRDPENLNTVEHLK